MNKKSIAMLTSLAIGGTLILGTAFANASQLSGYEAYKGAIKDTKNLKNETAVLTVSVSDNGKNLIDLSENFKQNLNTGNMSSVTTLKSGNNTQTFSTYRQDGKNISKASNSNEYTVVEKKNKNFQKNGKTENPEIAKSMEVVVDTLVGSMKDKVAASDSGNGTKKVTINLGSNDITPLFNALTSMAIIRNNDMQQENNKADLESLKNVLPQLQNDIKIESIDSTADVNKDNVIADQVANIVISGKDAQGKEHKITIKANLNLSNINSTTPDKIDLTGKQVKVVTSKFQEKHR